MRTWLVCSWCLAALGLAACGGQSPGVEPDAAVVDVDARLSDGPTDGPTAMPTFEQVWSRTAGGARDSIRFSLSQRPRVAVDRDGAVFVIGDLDGPFELDGTTVTPRGPRDALLVKLDPVDGQLRWVRTLGAEAGEGWRRIAVADDGSVWVLGSNSSFGADTPPAEVVTFAGQPHALKAKTCLLLAHYGSDGQELSLTVIEPSDAPLAFVDPVLTSLALAPDGSLYLSASVTGEIKFPDGTSVVAPAPGGVGSVIVARLTAAGTGVEWVTLLAASGASAFNRDLVAQDDAVVVVGELYGDLDLPGRPPLTSPGAGPDPFLVKLGSRDGAVAWGTSIPSSDPFLNVYGAVARAGEVLLFGYTLEGFRYGAGEIVGTGSAEITNYLTRTAMGDGSAVTVNAFEMFRANTGAITVNRRNGDLFLIAGRDYGSVDENGRSRAWRAETGMVLLVALGTNAASEVAYAVWNTTTGYYTFHKRRLIVPPAP